MLQNQVHGSLDPCHSPFDISGVPFDITNSSLPSFRYGQELKNKREQPESSFSDLEHHKSDKDKIKPDLETWEGGKCSGASGVRKGCRTCLEARRRVAAHWFMRRSGGASEPVRTPVGAKPAEKGWSWPDNPDLGVFDRYQCGAAAAGQATAGVEGVRLSGCGSEGGVAMLEKTKQVGPIVRI